MLSLASMTTLTRIGFAARGIMYVLIGYLAIRSGRTEDGAGALAFLDSGIGKPLLIVMALGFVAYGIWRLSEAFVDSEGHGSDAKGVAVRIGGAASGLIHLGLAFFALSLGMGGGSAGGDGTQQGAATALSFPGGQVALTVAAAALIATGLYQIVKAARADFLRHLDPKAAHAAWVEWLGRAGYAARGIVFILIGWFLWNAAREANAAEAGGIGEALESLPGGFQAAVAAGLLLFGLFSLVEARYRRINDPHVIERLKGKAQEVRS